MKKILILGMLVICASIIAKAPVETGAPGKVVVMTWENEDPNYSVLGPQPLVEYVEEKLNLEIEWRLFAHADRGTAITTMIAAGGTLPDLFPAFFGGDFTPQQLDEKGIIIPWSDVYDKAPLIKARLDSPEMAGVKHQLTDDDTGKVYAISTCNFNPLMLWTDYVRGDWMDKLGLETPETNEELYHVLRAFKNEDPNENGKQDEIPWQNFYEGVNWMKMWTRNVGLPTPDYSLSTVDTLYWASVDKEEIVYAPIHPRFKLMLEYLNILWEEGLINQEQFNMTSPKFTATVSDNTLGMQNMWPSAILSMQQQVRELDPAATWEAIPYPIEPGIMTPADRVYAFIGPVHHTFVLAKTGENTDNAIKLMNEVFGNPDMPFFLEYGIEGVHHEVVDGEVKYIGQWAEMDGNTRRSAMGSVFGHLPKIEMNFGVRAQIESDPIYEPHRNYISSIENVIKPATLWKLNQEQKDLYRSGDIEDIKTYVDESIAKFVVGTASLDNDSWQTYVDTVNKKAGDQIEAATAMLQEYFNSFIKASY